MRFSLVVCTYMRAEALQRLLESVRLQTLYPDEILIIDGSTNERTAEMLRNNHFDRLEYYAVPAEHRGLTRQRNYGIDRVNETSDIVCFLDDDTVLDPHYFENIIECYNRHPDAIGVGGVSINENKWQKNTSDIQSSSRYFVFEGHYIKESSRNYVRNILGLSSDKLPGIMPEFSHGRTFSYPLTGKDYPVDLLVGMSMSFRKSLFEKIGFSTYFEGYGLYEDADFSVRSLKYGKNYIATSAKLHHFHDSEGRPNKFKYGKMVVRNGWYVWRIKYPKPSFKAKLKWHAITLVLAFIRFSNIFTTNKRMEAFTEFFGRIVGWITLLFNKPGK